MGLIRWLRRHSLSLVLGALLASMVGVTLLLGPGQYRAEGIQGVGFWRWWVYETALSLEADVWGALVLVVFTKWLWEHRSAEAHDPPEEQQGGDECSGNS